MLSTHREGCGGGSGYGCLGRVPLVPAHLASLVEEWAAHVIPQVRLQTTDMFSEHVVAKLEAEAACRGD